jgi:hypothetical protein
MGNDSDLERLCLHSNYGYRTLSHSAVHTIMQSNNKFYAHDTESKKGETNVAKNPWSVSHSTESHSTESLVSVEHIYEKQMLKILSISWNPIKGRLKTARLNIRFA